MLTSASETIRKASLAEAQTTKIKKHVLWNVCIYPSIEILKKKNCFLIQNLTEIGKSTAGSMSCGQKRFVIKTADRHLKFLNIHIWSRDRHQVPNLYLCTLFHQNRIIFSLRYGNSLFSARFSFCLSRAVD